MDWKKPNIPDPSAKSPYQSSGQSRPYRGSGQYRGTRPNYSQISDMDWKKPNVPDESAKSPYQSFGQSRPYRGSGQYRGTRPNYSQISDMDWKKPNIPDESTKSPHQSSGQSRPYRGTRPNYSHSNVNPIRNYPKSFHSLETLKKLNEKNSSEILMELITKSETFSEFLESNLESDCIVLTLAIFSKVCSSSFTENKVVIINLAAKRSFIETLETYVANLPYEEMKTRNNHFWNFPNDFFVNLADVCESLIESIPTKACEVLPKLLKVVDVSVPTLEEHQSIKVSETTKSKIKTLIEKLDMCKKELEQKKRENESGVLPPDDFRTLSVYPTTEEILSPNPAFVRKNIIEGRYRNVEHYLDVQFRLLKEDFVAPLREGIAEYFEQSQRLKRYMKFSNVKLHPDVVFRSPIFEQDKVGVILTFSNQKASERIFSPRSKSFNYGSLVCFTKDSFGSILFGKVTDRDSKEKQLIISFDAEYNDFELNVPYLMVECKVFFEPYYHVLKALQCMSEVDFPMQRYLIDVDSSVEPPGYLDGRSSVFTIQDRSVDLFGNDWPSADHFQLNLTQYSAFKAALTQKFVVIQGPPGTGKTYLGLQIVKTLLEEENRQFWYNETPILIVCFTNHALDQFLLGLTSTTKSIVRVGGRSKCEELDEFNLRNARKKFRLLNENPLHVWRGRVEILLKELHAFSQELKLIKKYKHIIKFIHFKCIDENITTSWFFKASSSDMRTWLFADRRNKNIKFNSDITQLSETREDENEEEPNPFQNVNELHNQNVSDQFNDDLFDNISSKLNLTVLVSKHEMWAQIADLQRELQKVTSGAKKQKDRMKKWELERNLNDLWETFQYFKMRMRDGENSPVLMKPVNVNYRSPHRMHPNDRWNLYFYWLNLYHQHVVAKLVELQNTYQNVYKRYIEIRNMIDTEIMKKYLIVGMTTTSAARLQTTLQTLKCRIVVVEEAAEVLESHVTVSLTSHCQHLVLIGDHQQLRPTTASYRIEKKFNLGISMFERMVRNNMQCHMLGVQHRMRPEIANLIVPHIYPELENHYSVASFPPIMGMDSPLFFIHHDHQEVDEFDTKSNLHEAKFLTKLACYLRQNGYEPEDITILVAYSGQLFVVRDEVKRYDDLLHGVRICVLDNYQGEECKIILLSLVRNNREGKIGFLKIENRVCVALSRAKEGLYIMGNINLLCQNSEIWPKIKEVLVTQNSLGSYLSTRCRNHQNQVTKIQKPEDFNQVAEGGCTRPCGGLLKCGHHCPKACHMLDGNHLTYNCDAICSKVICEDGHACQKMCYKNCGSCITQVTRHMDCGHELVLPCSVELESIRCKITVTASLPCGHEVFNKPCYADLSKFRCPLKCDLRVEPCGHSCNFRCHINMDPEHLDMHRCRKPCEKIALECATLDHICPRQCSEECLPCKVKVKKNFPNCNHMQDVECSTNMNTIQCFKPCKKLLPCEHKCQRKCWEDCGGCCELVVKTSACGHEIMTKCSETPNRRDCIGACPKLLRCSHPCKKRCKDSCTDMCLEMVERADNAACGHNFKVECHMLRKRLPSDDVSLLQFCREPCSKILECSHKCSGSCGECFQGRLHLVCSEQCQITLICGHRCQSLCGDVCQPCNLKCASKCSHTKCNQICGKFCKKCSKPCSRGCKHTKCKAKCWDQCTVGPCQEPCKTLLKCAHACVGFCGDPCPPLCRICDREVLTEVFLGYEDEEGARFVLLDECKHVIESKGLEMYFQQSDTKNGVLVECKRCPRCKTPLASTKRYREYVKETKGNAVNLEMKPYGEYYEREANRMELKLQLNLFIKKISGSVSSDRRGYSRSTIHETILGNKTLHNIKTLHTIKTLAILHEYSRILNQKQYFNLLIGKIIKTKLTIFESIYMMNFKKLACINRVKIETYWIYLFNFLTRTNVRFTNQVILDFEREICRLQRIRQFFDIKTSNSSDLIETEKFIFRPIPYTKDFDDEIKAKLEGLYSKQRIKVPEMKCGKFLEDLSFKKPPQWFYCHNGHYYMDFGDPTQVAKCDQCWE